METPQASKQLKWIFGIALFGIADSIWLTVLHLSKQAMNRVCGVGALSRCDLLDASEYSELFGVPMAVWGLLFYVLVAAVARQGMKKGGDASRPVLWLLLLSLGSVATSVWMASVSVKLGAFCFFCSLLYVVSLVFLGLAGSAAKTVPRPWLPLLRSDVENAHRSVRVWGAIFAGLVLMTGGRFLFQRAPQVSGAALPIVAEAQRTLGPADAPVTIVIFSDFLCPYCKVAGEVVHLLEAETAGKAKIVYKFFPLDASCNRIGGRHEWACAAAKAANCAGRFGKFWPYHDLLYASQDSFSDSAFSEFAKTVGIDPEAFRSCLKDPSTLKAVQSDIEEGIGLNVQGTPAFFLNGRLYTGPPTINALKAALEGL